MNASERALDCLLYSAQARPLYARDHRHVAFQRLIGCVKGVAKL